MKKAVGVVAVLAMVLCFAWTAQAWDQGCNTCTTSEFINLQNVQVGAISQNLNEAQTGVGGGLAGSASYQRSTVTGVIVYDPYASVSAITVGGTIAGSLGNAMAGGANQGSAWGNAQLFSSSIIRTGFGR